MDRTAASPLKPNDADFTEQGLRRFKPYPEYKDSGVEWLGEIPAHWGVKRLRFVSSVNPSKSEIPLSEKDLEVSFIPMDYIGENGELRLDEVRSLENVYQGFTYFRNGDVVIAKITPCFENGKGALAYGLSNGIGFGTTELHVMRPKGNMDPTFLWYLSISAPFRLMGEFEMKGAAGQKRVPEDFIRDFRAPYFPIEEQRLLASFLDGETAKIDSLIAKREKLVELLQEKRNALISQAVTKGLDPNVPMKDSGVEWLGEIPSHWQVHKMKRIADIDYGIGLELDRTLTDGTPIISLPNILIDGTLVLKEVPFIDLVEQEKDKLLLKRGDLLFNWRSGSSDHVGKTALFDVDGEYTHVSFLLRIRFRSDEFIPRYFQRYLNTLRFRGFFLTTKAGVNNTFNQSELRELEILVPPTAEQSAIAAFIDCEAAEINMLIAKIGEGIDRLKEYRIALISAAVTGKIDVREETT
jgi:type I restriction enzyme S subunit